MAGRIGRGTRRGSNLIPATESRRIVLIEALDSAGAAAADAAVRAQALEKCGFEVHALAVELRREAEAGGHHPLDPDAVGVARDRKELRAALERLRPERVIVASVMPGGGAVARWLPAVPAARWWPAGLHPAAGPSVLSGWRGEAPLVSLGDGGAIHRRSAPGPFAGLDWSVLEEPASTGRRVSPWDGEYVLAPVPLEGRAGIEALEAFVLVARERDSLDLVLLSSPRPELDRLARRLGVAQRVHWAGRSPRPAEYVWGRSAAAILIGCGAPLSGGVVMRALACGAPVLASGGRGVGRLLRSWLEGGRYALPLPGTGVSDLAHALERALVRGPQVERAVTLGRALAARHHPSAFALRLAAALGVEAARGREAA